jgi:hypothetical protein
MTLADCLTLLAIVLGPLFGGGLAQHLQNRAFRQQRRMDIFRTLMRTRRTPMWPDHVGALNLVEIEFAKEKEVIDAWRELFRHLGTPHARRPDEATSDSMSPEEIGERNRRYDIRLGEERQRLLAKLLHAIAKALNFKIEQLEIFEGGYTPQGWVDIEVEQNVIRRFAARLAVGQSVLPIAVLDYTNLAQASGDQAIDQGSEAA